MRITVLCSAAILALAAGCGRDTGAVRARLTDAPLLSLTNVSSVEITVNEVRIHDDGDDEENEGEDHPLGVSGAAAHPDADSDGVRGKGWIVLCSGTQTFDLMKLRRGVYADLCPNAKEVPSGHIDEIWLDVVSVKISFNDGTAPVTLAWPRGPTNGLKLDVDHRLTVGGTVELKVDFDADASIELKADGTWGLHASLRENH